MMPAAQRRARALRPAAAHDGTASRAAASASIEERLHALKQLRADGFISDREYEAKRREMLERM